MSTLVWVLPFAEKDMHLIEKVGEFGLDVIELTPNDESKRIIPGMVGGELEKAGLVVISAAVSPRKTISPAPTPQFGGGG